MRGKRTILQQCVTRAEKFVDHACLPHHHRIETIILLRSSVADWYDSEACRTECETLWHLARRYTEEGRDKDTESALVSLRRLLDQFKRIVIENGPSDELPYDDVGADEAYDNMEADGTEDDMEAEEAELELPNKDSANANDREELARADRLVEIQEKSALNLRIVR